MKKQITIVIFCLATFAGSAQKRVIFDTDMGPDYDDVGAIALLHAFADSGKATILATVASTNYDGVAAVLSVLNTYFKRPGIPIGVPKKNARDLRDWQHWSDTLRANYPHAVKSNDDVPDATQLYRRLLAAQPDNSVTIITVGFFTNMASLLRSAPDKYSPLNGKALIKKKVHMLVSMAGKYPSGLEFNIEEDHESAKYALSQWPTQVIFSGFEIGERIVTGLPLVNDSLISNSPVKDVFGICIPMANEDSAGRKSWDETAVLAGVAGYEPYYTLVPGKIQIDDKGNNTWVNGALPARERSAQQYYIVEKMPVEQVEELINTLMRHQPR